MKLITARKEYTCDVCKDPIYKGTKYIKRSKSLGSPSKQTTKQVNGAVYYVVHGIRWTVEEHDHCTEKGEDGV